ncbi:MAG TPA: flagellar basal body P-ring protein FlgI [Rhodanobacteraceae bacterium]|nr:flagellar basal body P-ring protein FlgI [Rhodanobacteraceae bacterium]
MGARLAALLLAAAVGLCVQAPPARADRIGDLTEIGGARTNQLIGYGLVVGLQGSGDQTTQTPFTVQSLENMLQRLGVTVNSSIAPQLRDAAAVVVTASLPPFATVGQKISVTVSAIGNAGSLRGGQLLLTPLHGVNGQVYALAQGSVLVAGISAQGKSGSSVSVNITSAGRIPGGATVEATVPTSVVAQGHIALDLDTPSFTTATNIADAINARYGAGTAEAASAGEVQVRAPLGEGAVPWIASIRNLSVDPGPTPARVVINSRTGTVVIGSDVKVGPAAVASGSIEVSIGEQPIVSQPEPFSRGGQTKVVPSTTIKIAQHGGHMIEFGPAATLSQIVQAVNRVGASPTELVSILEALQRAGALHAQLVVI